MRDLFAATIAAPDTARTVISMATLTRLVYRLEDRADAKKQRNEEDVCWSSEEEWKSGAFSRDARACLSSAEIARCARYVSEDTSERVLAANRRCLVTVPAVAIVLPQVTYTYPSSGL